MLVAVHPARAAAVVDGVHTHACGLRRRAAVVARHLHHRGPLRQDRNGRRGQRAKAACGVDDIAVDHRQDGFDALDLLFRHAEVVFAQHRQIGELTDLNLPLLVLFAGEPCAALGPEHQGGVAIQTGAVIVHLHPADGTARDQPVEGGPRVVARHAGGIGA